MKTTAQEKELTNKVIAFLKQQFDYKPNWVDRRTRDYRIKLSACTSQDAIGFGDAIKKKFPMVTIKQAGLGKTTWCALVPFA